MLLVLLVPCDASAEVINECYVVYGISLNHRITHKSRLCQTLHKLPAQRRSMCICPEARNEGSEEIRARLKHVLYSLPKSRARLFLENDPKI